MPRVNFLTDEEKWNNRSLKVRDKCFLLMKKNKIRQKDIADLTGTTRQNISYQFNMGKLSIDTVQAILYLAKDADANSIMKVR